VTFLLRSRRPYRGVLGSHLLLLGAQWRRQKDESDVDWIDEAIVLSVRAHGETGAIVDAFTRTHGRHSGLVRGGNSHSKRPVLQPGNGVALSWRAGLSEHLGCYSVELVSARAGAMMEARDALAGLNAVTALMCAALPERAPNSALYEATTILLDAMLAEDFGHWGALYVRWEAGLLEALGYGLDLTRCAATGAMDDLRYVSPRSGRAVSGAAGAAYAERLLPLPPFLLGWQNAVAPGDVAAGLRLAAHFLKERVLRPQGKDLPPARQRLSVLAQ
jgi:DNA repair protein RecO (recombination protein O)